MSTDKGHVARKCTGECNGCMFCHGGLFACVVCGGCEGSVPTECPGYRMAHDTEERVYSGWVDFVGGKWVALGKSDAAGRIYVENPRTGERRYHPRYANASSGLPAAVLVR